MARVFRKLEPSDFEEEEEDGKEIPPTVMGSSSVSSAKAQWLEDLKLIMNNDNPTHAATKFWTKLFMENTDLHDSIEKTVFHGSHQHMTFVEVINGCIAKDISPQDLVVLMWENEFFIEAVKTADLVGYHFHGSALGRHSECGVVIAPAIARSKFCKPSKKPFVGPM